MLLLTEYSSIQSYTVANGMRCWIANQMVDLPNISLEDGSIIQISRWI